MCPFFSCCDCVPCHARVTYQKPLKGMESMLMLISNSICLVWLQCRIQSSRPPCFSCIAVPILPLIVNAFITCAHGLPIHSGLLQAPLEPAFDSFPPRGRWEGGLAPQKASAARQLWRSIYCGGSVCCNAYVRVLTKRGCSAVTQHALKVRQHQMDHHQSLTIDLY